MFLDTNLHKGPRFEQIGIIDFETTCTENFMYLHRSSAHPRYIFKGFINGEIIRYKRDTSDPNKPRELMLQFNKRIISDYPIKKHKT